MLERDPPRVGRGEGVKTTWERGRPARTKTTRERGRPARTKTTRERGRLARTKLGTMEENPVKAGSVRLAREWPWMAGCLQE